jgi:hypothetical protein
VTAAQFVGGGVGLFTGGIKGVAAGTALGGPLVGWIAATAVFAVAFYLAWTRNKDLRDWLERFLKSKK